MSCKIKYLSLILLIFASSQICHGQTSTEELTDEFFNEFLKSPERAFDFLTQNIKNLDPKATKNLKEQFLFNLSQSGNYYGQEMISEKTIGNSLKLQSFLMKFEMNPVRLTLTFYKPEDDWIIAEYEFDANLTKELKETRKITK